MNLVHVKNQDNVMHVGHTIMKQRWSKDPRTDEWKEASPPMRAGLHRISASAGIFFVGSFWEENLARGDVYTKGSLRLMGNPFG